MKHLFIPYELALKAKEAGFNEPCFSFWYKQKNGKYRLNEGAFGVPSEWTNEMLDLTTRTGQAVDKISAPLYQQIIDWLRDTKGCYIELRAMGDLTYWNYLVETKTYRQINAFIKGTYYEALTKAIEEAFTLI